MGKNKNNQDPEKDCLSDYFTFCIKNIEAHQKSHDTLCEVCIAKLEKLIKKREEQLITYSQQHNCNNFCLSCCMRINCEREILLAKMAIKGRFKWEQ